MIDEAKKKYPENKDDIVYYIYYGDDNEGQREANKKAFMEYYDIPEAQIVDAIPDEYIDLIKKGRNYGVFWILDVTPDVSIEIVDDPEGLRELGDVESEGKVDKDFE